MAERLGRVHSPRANRVSNTISATANVVVHEPEPPVSAATHALTCDGPWIIARPAGRFSAVAAIAGVRQSRRRVTTNASSLNQRPPCCCRIFCVASR
jgi:hypothetical protein